VYSAQFCLVELLSDKTEARYALSVDTGAQYRPPMFTLPDHGVQLGVTTPAAMRPVAKLFWTLVVQTVLFIYCVVICQ